MGNIFHRIILGAIAVISITIYSCGKDEPSKPVIETSTVIDNDGNTYLTVKIGNQWWMAENLKTTRFRNGDLIDQIQDGSEWSQRENAAYCIYDNSTVAPGLLYNWYAVNDPRGIAPEGWRVATENDWQTLERALGLIEEEINKLNWRNSGDVGNKLKPKGPEGWLTYDGVWGNNNSGFLALSGGCRLWNGKWSNPGLKYSGYFWTGTSFSNTEAWFRHLDYKSTGVFRFYVNMKYGMSIRCVKN